MKIDPIGAIAGWLTAVIVDYAVDASEEALPRFGRRYPRTLRFARLVGGAFLLVAGFYEAVLALVVFVDVASTGELDDLVATPVLLLPFSMGVGLTIWGLRMMRRGWASRLHAPTPSPDPDPYIPKAAHDRPERPDGYWRV